MDRDLNKKKGRREDAEPGAETRKGGEENPDYLGRAWEAVKESVGIDRWTDAQDSKAEKAE